ncbi:hypothetical protein IJ818_03060 [bacterium]|nr:hypothetical protein [bacterium]
MSNNMRTPGYMNYSKYKKDKKNNFQNFFLLFITAFLVMLLFFTAVARHLSPDVDVAIGDEEEIEAKETGLGVKRFIDDRLKFIQQEDQGIVKKAVDKRVEEESVIKERMNDDTLVPELDEKVVIPYAIQKQEQKTVKTEEKPAQKVEAKPAAPTYNSTFKVVVGKYSTIEQARVAQSILQDSEVGVSSFIKTINGTYTLQVGSFTERAKAESLLNELLRNSFPARIVQE